MDKGRAVDVETIIVGGGIAGLACARRLSEAGKDFLLITKDVGGRIRFSKDGAANYGAVLVTSAYSRVMPYVQKRRVLRKRDACCYIDGGSIMASGLALRHPVQLLRAFFLSARFYYAYRTFQKRAVRMSQKRAIEADPYLAKLYAQNARDFVVEKGIADFAETIAEPLLWGIAVSRIKEQNAFNYQLISLLLFGRSHEFFFDTKAFTAPFAGKIALDEVVALSKDGETNMAVTAAGKMLKAKHIVIATPADAAQKLLHLPKINQGRNVHVLHVRGAVKDEFRRGAVKIIGYATTVIGIIAQTDGTFIVYALEPEADLAHYFSSWEIVGRADWEPIYHNIGNTLLDADRGDKIWLIGDHNVIGVEDSFITGLYAAHEICREAHE